MHMRKILRTGFVLMVVTAITHAGAIHDAANRGDLETLKRLIKSDPESLDRPGPSDLTPLGCAARQNQKAAVILLLDEGARDTATAAIQAAAAGHLDLLKAIYERGISARVRDKHRATLLIHAVIAGHAEMVRYLVDEIKLEVNATGRHDQTALHAAAENGHVAVLRLLCAAAANFEAKTSFRNRQKLSNSITALMMAARIGRVDCVQALLTAGAAIDARSTYEETALLHAVTALLLATRLRSLSIVKVLVEAGADVNARVETGSAMKAEAKGKSVLAFARARLDSKGGAKKNPELVEMVRYLKSKGAK